MKATILVVGRTKVGKTTDAFFAFGKRAFGFVTERGALDPVQANFGWTPDHVELLPCPDPYKAAMDLLTGPVTRAAQSGEHSAVILDSITALADRILLRNMHRFNGDGRKVYPQTDMQVKSFLDVLLALPTWVVGIAHEAHPKSGEDYFVRGGPKLPGRELVESVPGMFRMVLRAVVASNSERRYLCDSLDQQWVMGDGYGAAEKSQPMDLRPILWRIMRGDTPVPAELLRPKPYRVVKASDR
jgi:hypothetical protein